MLLSLLAFNLLSALRIEYEGAAGSCLDLARFQRDVLKAGGRVVKRARRLVLQLAQVVAPFWKQLSVAYSTGSFRSAFPSPAGREPVLGASRRVTPSSSRSDANSRRFSSNNFST